jgi:hypothetical protein
MSHLSPLVLFVDDDADTREMYQLALHLEGFAVVVAANVADAIRCVMETPPAVIVTDLAMPGMDGHELISWLHVQGKIRDAGDCLDRVGQPVRGQPCTAGRVCGGVREAVPTCLTRDDPSERDGHARGARLTRTLGRRPH